jgi:hypothetical protein
MAPTMTTMTTPLVPVGYEAPSNMFSLVVDDMGTGERIKYYKAMQGLLPPFQGNRIAVKRVANDEF